MSLRPNPAALLSQDDSDDEDEEENYTNAASAGKGNKDQSEKNVVYKAPKLNAAPYKDDETAADKNAEKLQRKRKKLKNSEILSALREEFGDAPEVFYPICSACMSVYYSRSRCYTKCRKCLAFSLACTFRCFLRIFYSGRLYCLARISRRSRVNKSRGFL